NVACGQEGAQGRAQRDVSAHIGDPILLAIQISRNGEWMAGDAYFIRTPAMEEVISVSRPAQHRFKNDALRASRIPVLFYDGVTQKSLVGNRRNPLDGRYYLFEKRQPKTG